jgi:hypothetical protein
VPRAAQLLSTFAVAWLATAGVAYGAPAVKLHASFTPEHLGQQTSVSFTVQITMPAGGVPPPLTEAVVRYPAGVNIGLSELGIDTCQVATLERFGPEGCRADSIMGEGRAIGALQIGPEVISETAHVTVLRAPQREGSLAMMFYVDAGGPVAAQLVLPGLLAPAPARFGGEIKMQLPLVEGLPGGPDVAVTLVQLALGPRGLTYYEHVHGKLVPYHPRGILLPNHCPRGGFPFSGTFIFLNGGRTNALTSVPCPGPGSSRRAR